MLVILPPSEGKTAPDSGPTLNLSSMSLPELNPAREELIERLIALCAGDTAVAAEALGVGAKVLPSIARNVDLRSAPTAPAIAVYSGVLYKEFAHDTLSNAEKRRASQMMLIASALWGVTGLDDLIPDYRMSIGTKLEGLGGLARYWREPLANALPNTGLVVDLRSAAYSAAWSPSECSFVSVGAVRLSPDGTRKPISHMAKAARGRVARLLAQSAVDPEDPKAVASAIEAGGERVELEQIDTDLDRYQLTIVEN